MFSYWQKPLKPLDANNGSRESKQNGLEDTEDANGIDEQESIEIPKKEDIEYHWEALERILYIFARSNHSIGYIQGMNSLICPLYFVCANDRDEDNQSNPF